MAKVEISLSPNLKLEVQTPIGTVKYKKKIECIKEDEKTCHEAVVKFLEQCQLLNKENKKIIEILQKAIDFVNGGKLSMSSSGVFSKDFLQIVTINENWKI